MPRFFYDLHLHSCLSPCGDDEMSPSNLVNMSKLCGQDIIALTDHNSVANCPAALKAAQETGIVLVPGMELCTAEEIHVVCLFPHLEAALDFGRIVDENRLPIANKPDVFGRQLVMDETDKILGEEPLLLVAATQIAIDDVWGLCSGCDGVCFPAHIDRSSFSLPSVFGVFPPDFGFTCAEVSLRGDMEQQLQKHPALSGLSILRSSDAHRLEDIPEAHWAIELEQCTAPCLVQTLRTAAFK